MKKLFILFVTFSFAFSLSGCKATEVTITDREGNEVVVPTEINKIVSTAPSNTEVIMGLGLGDKLVAVDKYSPTEGLSEDIEIINFRDPDVEVLIALQPDIIVASGHNKVGDEDPFKLLKEAGIAVVYIPTPTSLEAITEDITFIGSVLGAEKEAEEMITAFNAELDAIREIAKTITDKKEVYFEIGDYSGSLYSVGNSTFLDEVISLVGGVNIYNGVEGWPNVSAEDIITKNPDIIISNQDWDTEIISKIKARTGFDVIDAVINNQVFVVGGNTTSRGSQNVIKGIKEVAEAIYPNLYDFE